MSQVVSGQEVVWFTRPRCRAAKFARKTRSFSTSVQKNKGRLGADSPNSVGHRVVALCLGVGVGGVGVGGGVPCRYAMVVYVVYVVFAAFLAFLFCLFDFFWVFWFFFGLVFGFFLVFLFCFLLRFTHSCQPTFVQQTSGPQARRNGAGAYGEWALRCLVLLYSFSYSLSILYCIIIL